MHQRRIAGASVMSLAGSWGSRSSGGILHGERHDHQAPAYGFVDVIEVRLVIAGDEQFEYRGEVEEVMPHEPCGHFVAAGHGFDFHLVPAAAAFGFLCDDQAGAVELGDVGRMAFVVMGEEGAAVGDGGVIAENTIDRIEQGAFAVGAGAVGKDAAVF